ncbi:MAG: hypothetical protein WC718_10150 [Phycisphaerales bacterium]|jgi:hypothetical protein
MAGILGALVGLLGVVFTQPALPDVPVDPCESAMIADARRAISNLKAAAAQHGGERTAISATYEGTLRVEAHMLRPGMTREIPVTIEVIDDPQSQGLRVRETSGQKRSVETTIILGGRVASQSDADGPFKELVGEAAQSAAADAVCWMPWSALRAGLAAPSSCRLGPPLTWQGATITPVTCVDRAGRACSVLLDGEHRVGRIEALAADQRLGDVCAWTSLSDFEQHEGAWVPRKMSRFVVQPSVTLRYDLSLTAVHIGSVPPDTFTLPEARKADIASWGVRSPGAGIEFVAVAPRVWAAEVAASDSRVLVIERDHDLVTVGAPDGDEVCTALIAALRERFPDKPIGIATVGHHHPAPSGGLRAMAATGATIVLPRGLEAYARWMLSRSTDLGAPAVAFKGEPRLQLFDGETTIDCGDEQLRLFDIGEKSAHAYHFVVFYLPKAGVLFEDDLGYFPNNRAARSNPRLVGLVEAMGGLQIKPTRLIQAWPVRGVLREVPWPDVEAIVSPAK